MDRGESSETLTASAERSLRAKKPWKRPAALRTGLMSTLLPLALCEQNGCFGAGDDRSTLKEPDLPKEGLS